MPDPDRGTADRFEIALSFPGEEREFVLKIAQYLEAKLGTGSIFYDEWFEPELLGVDLDLKLRNIYRSSRLVVPFFSIHYGKQWCRLEWSTLRAILLERRKDVAVIPVDMDGTTVSGWEAVDLALRRNGAAPEVVAEKLLKAYYSRCSSESGSALPRGGDKVAVQSGVANLMHPGGDETRGHPSSSNRRSRKRFAAWVLLTIALLICSWIAYLVANPKYHFVVVDGEQRITTSNNEKVLTYVSFGNQQKFEIGSSKQIGDHISISKGDFVVPSSQLGSIAFYYFMVNQNQTYSGWHFPEGRQFRDPATFKKGGKFVVLIEDPGDGNGMSIEVYVERNWFPWQ